jgi:hypothetical protein
MQKGINRRIIEKKYFIAVILNIITKNRPT